MMPVYPVYGGYPYAPAMANPFQPQQQRLAEMEQQYQTNQTQQQMQQPQAQPMQPMPQQMPVNPGFVRCRPVTSIDEVRASMVDLDGTLNVFTNVGNGEIYTKQINLDGTATLNTYILKERPKEPERTPKEQEINLDGFVKQEELESVCASFAQQIDDLQDQLKGYERAFAMMKEEKKPTTKTTGGAKK